MSAPLNRQKNADRSARKADKEAKRNRRGSGYSWQLLAWALMITDAFRTRLSVEEDADGRHSAEPDLGAAHASEAIADIAPAQNDQPVQLTSVGEPAPVLAAPEEKLAVEPYHARDAGDGQQLSEWTPVQAPTSFVPFANSWQIDVRVDFGRIPIDPDLDFFEGFADFWTQLGLEGGIEELLGALDPSIGGVVGLAMTFSEEALMPVAILGAIDEDPEFISFWQGDQFDVDWIVQASGISDGGAPVLSAIHGAAAAEVDQKISADGKSITNSAVMVDGQDWDGTLWVTGNYYEFNTIVQINLLWDNDTLTLVRIDDTGLKGGSIIGGNNKQINNAQIVDFNGALAIDQDAFQTEDSQDDNFIWPEEDEAEDGQTIDDVNDALASAQNAVGADTGAADDLTTGDTGAPSPTPSPTPTAAPTSASGSGGGSDNSLEDDSPLADSQPVETPDPDPIPEPEVTVYTAPAPTIDLELADVDAETGETGEPQVEVIDDGSSTVPEIVEEQVEEPIEEPSTEAEASADVEAAPEDDDESVDEEPVVEEPVVEAATTGNDFPAAGALPETPENESGGAGDQALEGVDVATWDDDEPSEPASATEEDGDQPEPAEAVEASTPGAEANGQQGEDAPTVVLTGADEESADEESASDQQDDAEIVVAPVEIDTDTIAQDARALQAAEDEAETPVVEAAVDETETPAVEAAEDEAETPVVEAAEDEAETPVVEAAEDEAETPVVEAAEDEAETPVVEAAEDEAESPVVEAAEDEVETPVVEAAEDEAESPVVEAAEDETETPVVEAAEDEAETPVVEAAEDEAETPVVEAAEDETETPVVEAAEDEAETPVVEAAEDEAETPVVEAAEGEAETPVVEAAEDETETPAVEAAEDEAETPVVEAVENEAETPVVEAADDEAETPVVEAAEDEAETPVVEAAGDEAETPVVEAAEDEPETPVVEAAEEESTEQQAQVLALTQTNEEPSEPQDDENAQASSTPTDDDDTQSEVEPDAEPVSNYADMLAALQEQEEDDYEVDPDDPASVTTGAIKDAVHDGSSQSLEEAAQNANFQHDQNDDGPDQLILGGFKENFNAVQFNNLVDLDDITMIVADTYSKLMNMADPVDFSSITNGGHSQENKSVMVGGLNTGASGLSQSEFYEMKKSGPIHEVHGNFYEFNTIFQINIAFDLDEFFGRMNGDEVVSSGGMIQFNEAAIFENDGRDDLFVGGSYTEYNLVMQVNAMQDSDTITQLHAIDWTKQPDIDFGSLTKHGDDGDDGHPGSINIQMPGMFDDASMRNLSMDGQV